MFISGTTIVIVNGRPTRVCGRRFNQALRGEGLRRSDVKAPTGETIVPVAPMSWLDVAAKIRACKKVQAALVRFTK